MKRRTPLRVEMMEPRCLLSSLAYSLTTNQSTFQVGQPIDFSFTETNTSASPVNIAVGPVNSGFDVMHDGVTVWASNAGLQPQFLRLVTLQPGQSETLTATWNGIPNSGPSAVVTGTFTVTNQQAPTGASATFQIDSEPTSPGKTPVPPQSDAPLSATLTTNKPAYRRGEPVEMTLTLTNNSDTSVTITPDTGADGFYARRGGVLVWHQVPKAATEASLGIAPGQSVSLVATWNGRPNQADARSTHPGTYTLIADEGGYQVSTTIEIGKVIRHKKA